MWNKTYLIALAVAVLIISSLYFYSYGWLGSPGAPVSVVENYEYYSGLAWTFLWFSSIVLLILGNVLLWRAGQAWGLWTTLLYFAFFVIVQTFWLDESFSTFKNRNGMTAQNSVSLGALVGVVICAIAAIIVFFDQFLVSRMHKKMFGVTPEEVAPRTEEIE